MKSKQSTGHDSKKSLGIRPTGNRKRLRRADFHVEDFVAVADIPVFFENLTTALPEARKDIVENSQLCVPGTREALLHNPIIALAQQTLSNGQPWDRAQLRKFISKDCSFANDITLLGYGISQGWLTPEMQHFVQEQQLKSAQRGRRLNDPYLSKGTCADRAHWGWDELHFRWDQIVDLCRERIRLAARSPVAALSVQTIVPSSNAGRDKIEVSMKRDRLYWTIVKALGIHDEDANMRMLIDQFVCTVAKSEIVNFLHSSAPSVPGGGHASWALLPPLVTDPNEAQIQMLVRGLGRLLGQSTLPKNLVAFSPYRREGYSRPCRGEARWFSSSPHRSPTTRC
jgi:hypothetical protein